MLILPLEISNHIINNLEKGTIMRKSLLLFASVLTLSPLSAVTASAQDYHPILIEEFTNDGCNPCAKYSPILDKFINERLGDVIAVKYHVGFPDYNDPIFLSQQSDIDSRMTHYNITAAPTNVVNGRTVGNVMTSAWLEEATNAYRIINPHYDLDAYYKKDGNKLTVHTTVRPDTDACGDTLRLFVAVLEEHVDYDSALPNGETELNYTCRKLLTGGEGCALPSEMLKGQDYKNTFEWEIENFKDEKELSVVAWIEGTGSQFTHATYYIPKAPQQETAMELLSLTGTPDNICIPNYYGSVIVRNKGQQGIDQATLNVKVNGTLKQYTWTGWLEYLGKDTIDFADFTEFELNNSSNYNEVEVWLSNINDDGIESNHITNGFSNAINASGAVQLRFYTDKAPEETTWKLLNSAGDVVEQGGPLSEPRHFYTYNFKLDKEDCYTLEFLDSGKNGIVGENGNGYFILYQLNEDGKKTKLLQGDYDGSIHDTYFHLASPTPTLGIREMNEPSTLTQGSMYNLNGIEIKEQPHTGVYIQNGKKVSVNK